VSDGIADVVVTAYLAINSIIDPPTAIDDSYEFGPGEDFEASASDGVVFNDIVIELSPDVAAVIYEPTQFGSIQLDITGAFIYVPGPTFTGSDVFKYILQQGNAVSEPATVAIELVFDLDAFKIAMNQKAGLLEDDIEETEGAFVPVNSDVDLYREAGVTIRHSTSFQPAVPNYDIQWDQDMWWNVDAIAIPEENDLLPIILPKSDGKYKYTLTIPDHLRVWKKADRTGIVGDLTELEGDGEAARTLYVEGIAAGSGLLKLNVQGAVVKADVDRVTISTFTWSGPQNVPGNAIYDYYATGGKPGEALWTGATSGGLLDDAVDHAIIKWDSGPAVGAAVYQASLKYQWGLNVNVVNVDIRPNDENDTPVVEFTSGTPSSGPVNGAIFPLVSRTVPDGSPGLSWKANVVLTGPSGNRGVSYISGGFTQALMHFHAKAKFDTVNKIQELQPSTPIEFPIRDATRTMPAGSVLYTNSPQAVFNGSSTLISANDTPGLPIPLTYDKGVSVEAGDDVVDSTDIRYDFRLDVSVKTSDNHHDPGFEDQYTRSWTVNWWLDLSGTVAGEPYAWTAGTNAGAHVVGGWAPITDGTRPLLGVPPNAIFAATDVGNWHDL
jgi:hypothetical protein